MPSSPVLPAEAKRDCAGELDIEALLLSRIAAGDRVALGELYCRTSASLRNVAAFILSDLCEAEDVIQEVFLVIWNRAALFDATRGSSSAWLASITRRRAIDRWRSRARETTLSQPFIAEQTLGVSENAAPSTEERTRDEDDRRVVRCAVAALPTDMRCLIELLYFRGISQAAAAEKLGEPLGTIKARARRALARLRILLRRAGFEDAERMDENALECISPVLLPACVNGQHDVAAETAGDLEPEATVQISAGDNPALAARIG